MEVIKSDFVLVCHAGLAPASSGFAMLFTPHNTRQKQS
jgi:hypothetical protein